MAKLSITNFSCISSAEIELGDFTVLVGPQASGKSVISKLIYFANDILTKQFTFIEDGATLRDFTRDLEQQFLKLFPAMAWGGKRFVIIYQAGEYELKVTGTRKSGSAERTRNKMRVEFSEKFSERYTKWLNAWVEQKNKLESKKGGPVPPFEFFWRFREACQKELRAALKENLFNYQLFIPAGRSFFTSVGKAIAVFERGGILDPVTVEFGRTFAALREHRGRRFYRPDHDLKQSLARKKALMQRFFGGSIEFGRDEEFVQTPDGRRVPFSVLSSGQQELLPLWMVLDEIVDYRTNSLVFIEEPEAHLFPSSQADITSYLASLVSGQKRPMKILITTHSPYVLANINNLLKAGALGSKYPEARTALEKIIPKTSWLSQEQVKAFALKDGNVNAICHDGLIDAEYLDEVSGQIAAQFLELLEIENQKWSSPTVKIEIPTPE